MTWKVKKEFENLKLPNLNYCLGDLNEKQIRGLGDHYKELYFTKDKPKKKQELDDSENNE